MVLKELPRTYHSGAYLFLSFDMVNSTQFKCTESRWPFVMHHFYTETVKAVRAVSSAFNVWKYMGDEVVFWCHLPANTYLPKFIGALYLALQIVRERLNDLQVNYEILTQNIIGVKGTAWIAVAEHVASHELESHLLKDSHLGRIIEEEIDGAKSVLVDFIGQEIDIGFRIAKFAHNGFLQLNASLAALMLLQQPESAEVPARIVALEPLKGVWGGRPYPIIWYCDPWDHSEENFAYDELLQNLVIARVLGGQTQPLKFVNKILRDMNQERYIALLYEHLTLARA